ncbi:hypothetical protein NDU88_005846 [Pleurodeles waltl]|uniref:Uncharacterized protein n=1 Tax=Pleurodeles waltl TaxID=8319 RepID=A0AAV7LMC5_PLEWA|nr:hypothetical protein NDU88_005846 [Pleurodeles waltl]
MYSRKGSREVGSDLQICPTEENLQENDKGPLYEHSGKHRTTSGRSKNRQQRRGPDRQIMNQLKHRHPENHPLPAEESRQRRQSPPTGRRKGPTRPSNNEPLDRYQFWGGNHCHAKPGGNEPNIRKHSPEAHTTCRRRHG